MVSRANPLYSSLATAALVKVLFMCVGNINRSQIAEAIFNRLSKGDRAVSAGLRPRQAGIMLRKEHHNPVEVMGELDYDLSKAKIKKVDERRARSADKVVLIFERKHLAEVPSYIRNRPGVELWEVGAISDDIPYGEYCALERKRIRQIETHVKVLIKKLEGPRV
jgi:protein-tyrosine-phosphatase